MRSLVLLAIFWAGVDAIRSPVGNPPCGGSSGLECADGQYCHTWTGRCNATGFCINKPTNCIFRSHPVCGCDGVSYDSSCDAYRAGISVQSFKACAGDPLTEPSATTTPWSIVIAPADKEPLPAPHKLRVVKCGQGFGECSVGQYCRMGSCHAPVGQCIDIPVWCPSTRHAPVCGCDGFSYSSSCEAGRASATIAHYGACAQGAPVAKPISAPVPVSQSCVLGSTPCVNPRDSCVAPFGTCNTDGVGFCEDASLLECEQSPVCGCDDVTYASICDAYRNSVSVRSQGRCGAMVPVAPPPVPFGAVPAGSPCEVDDDCDAPMYCATARGQCGGVGKCAWKPKRCGWRIKATAGTSGGEVCGCDGATYSSECHANAAGVSVDEDGSCFVVTEIPSAEGDSGCSTDLECAADQFCNFDQAACGNGPDSGVCTDVPFACPVIRQWPTKRPMHPHKMSPPRPNPKFGHAGASGTARDAEAAEEVEGVGASSAVSGAVHGVVGAAAKAVGVKGGAGAVKGIGKKIGSKVKHSWLPWLRPSFQTGVCGCDGKSYTAVCDAHKAKISVKHKGRCHNISPWPHPSPSPGGMSPWPGHGGGGIFPPSWIKMIKPVKREHVDDVAKPTA